MITQKIKLNLIPGGILPRIKASQYDSGARTLKFQLYNEAQEFLIPSGSTVSIRGTKSDHTGFQYECEYSGSEVTAKITDQMTVSPGEVLAELVITKDDNRIATGNFIFDNEEAALKDDIIISHTDIPAIEHLDDIVDLVEEDAAIAAAAKEAVQTAASQAASSATSAATSASNASASASQASASATAAATSAANASASESNASASALAAKTSEDNAADSEDSASASATAAALSESNASASETNAAASALAASGSATNASASATAAAISATNASTSETNADSSATQAQTSASAASESQAAAALSETNAATSASAAATSATNAATSESNASTNASSASTSATNAANSETLARKWAVGDSGSGSATPSDTNNAYYWAQRAQQAAGGGLHKEVVNTLPTTNIDTNTIYLVPSSDPESENVKDEYINLNGTTSGWELIGSTKVDLTNYYTKTQTDTFLDEKLSEDYANVYGAKNLIPYPYYDSSETTDNGITYTVNSDGSVHAEGTATATSDFVLADVLELPNGDYILTGDTDSETAYANSSILFNEKSISGTAHWNYGAESPCVFTVNNYTLRKLRIRITSGAFVNQTFYPMLRLASIKDDTYQPYAKTNKELTKDVNSRYTKSETDALLDGKTPVYGKGINLLDNWYFIGGGSQQGGGQFPINQRAGYITPAGTRLYTDTGLTNLVGTQSEPYHEVKFVNNNYCSYKTSTEGVIWYVNTSDAVLGYTNYSYTIDRWSAHAYGSYVTLHQDYISISAGTFFQQKAEPWIFQYLVGKQVTFSILMGDGNFYSNTITFNTTENIYLITEKFSAYASVPNSINELIALYILSPITIQAIKLELGTEQTLAHQDVQGNWVLNDPPPNFQQELAKCQRYFFNTKDSIFIGLPYTTGNGRITTNLPVEMRVLPSVDISRVDYSTSYLDNIGNGRVGFSGFLNLVTKKNQFSADINGATGLDIAKQLLLYDCEIWLSADI